MRFLPHAHRISLLSPAPVSHIFHSCRPSMPRKQKAASVPTPIKQSHKAMVVSYRPQTLHDTIHTVLPGEVLPAIPSYSESSRNLFATYIPLRQRKKGSDILRRFFDTIQFLLPLINRIISAGRDHIDTVPPGYMIFLIFVRVIRHQSMIFHYFSSSLLIQRAHAARPATCFTSPVATSVWNSFTETSWSFNTSAGPNDSSPDFPHQIAKRWIFIFGLFFL